MGDDKEAGAGLEQFIVNGCNARPEDKHHALQELSALRSENADLRRRVDEQNEEIKELNEWVRYWAVKADGANE